MLQDEVAGLPHVDQFVRQTSVLVHLLICLCDEIFVFFPGGQIEGVRNVVCALSLFGLQFLIFLFDRLTLDVLGHLVLRIAGADDRHIIDDAAALDFAIRTFDKPVFVDSGVTAQRRNQSDVRTFRRFNRAYAPVVCRVYVANFESGTLARETAGSKSRQPPLVRDFRKRIRLIHELRQLRRPEELTYCGDDRLGVDQVMRHGSYHFLVHRHLFLDRPLHPDQANAELVLQQLADCADAAIAKMIDVVHLPDIFAELEQVSDNGVEISRLQNALLERCGEIQFDIEFQAADF